MTSPTFRRGEVINWKKMRMHRMGERGQRGKKGTKKWRCHLWMILNYKEISVKK
jgi:hypothetical protein